MSATTKSIDVSAFVEGKWYSIKKVSDVTGWSPNYVRSLMRKSKLESKVGAPGGVPKRFISATSLIAYIGAAATTNRSKRCDGRNKYIVYLTTAERDALLAAHPEITTLLSKAPTHASNKKRAGGTVDRRAASAIDEI